MQKQGQVSAGGGKKLELDRTALRKRQWVTPAVRKLKVDQTEAMGPPGDDGIVSAS